VGIAERTGAFHGTFPGAGRAPSHPAEARSLRHVPARPALRAASHRTQPTMTATTSRRVLLRATAALCAALAVPAIAQSALDDILAKK
jgi:hypothetical protein